MNGRRVLVVGDQPEVIKMWTWVLRWREWDVAPALSVAEALDRLYPPPDCLLANLVLSLPDGSLYDVIRAARARSPGVRVVLLDELSDCYDEEVVRRVKEQGFGLPDDGSASDEQYDEFFRAYDRTRDHLLHKEIGDVVLVWALGALSPDELIRACEPA
jgi:CheY-like chemotaxis protein